VKLGPANALAVLLALVAGVSLSGALGDALEQEPAVPEGVRTVTDASGDEVPVARYERIASASSIADQVLEEILEPDRVVAVAAHSKLRAPERWRYADRDAIERLEDLEEILSLSPDLLFVNDLADAGRVARLRERGVRVFDLGPMQGLRTLLPNIRDIGTVVGEPERAERLAASFERRMRSVADVAAPEEAMFLSVLGDQLYGGTTETSYADILDAAGLVDVAERAGYEGWPVYGAEDVLALDPEWIVVPEGDERALCRHVGLDALRACREGHVRGVPLDLVSDPGLGMLPAAEAVHDAIYGAPR